MILILLHRKCMHIITMVVGGGTRIKKKKIIASAFYLGTKSWFLRMPEVFYNPFNWIQGIKEQLFSSTCFTAFLFYVLNAGTFPICECLGASRDGRPGGRLVLQLMRAWGNSRLCLICKHCGGHKYLVVFLHAPFCAKLWRLSIDS